MIQNCLIQVTESVLHEILVKQSFQAIPLHDWQWSAGITRNKYLNSELKQYFKADNILIHCSAIVFRFPKNQKIVSSYYSY